MFAHHHLRIVSSAVIILISVTASGLAWGDKYEWDAYSGLCLGEAPPLKKASSAQAVAADTCARRNTCSNGRQASCSYHETAPHYQGTNIVLRVHIKIVDLNAQGDRLPEAIGTGGYGYKVKEGPECSDKSGNPVSVTRGEKFYQFNDVTLGGGAFPIRINRTYNTYVTNNPQSNPMGSWDFTYLSNTFFVSGDEYTLDEASVTLSNGQVFSFDETGVATNEFVNSNAGFRAQLTRDDTVTPTLWTFVSASGTAYIFEQRTGAAETGSGYLVGVTSTQGYSHTVTYDGDITSFVPVDGVEITDDQSGSKIRYSLASTGLPTELSDITDNANSVILRTYTWDVDGRLTSVAYPNDFTQQFNYDTANYTPDTSRGKTADNYKHLITGITEIDNSVNPAVSTVYSNVTYDKLGRVSLSELDNDGTGVESTAFTYNWTWYDNITNPQTILANNAGLQTAYQFLASSGISSTRNWKTVSIIGASHLASGCTATSYNTTYDPNGFLESTEDTIGTITKRTRDSNGRIKAYETGLGTNENLTAASQKIETTWHVNTDLNLPMQKKYFASTGTDPNFYWESTAYKVVDLDYYATNNRIKSRKITDQITGSNLSREWTYAYLPLNTSINITKMTVADPLSNDTVYNYNASGQLTSVVNAASQTTAYASYNGFGLPQTITDANGVITQVAYDVRGRVSTITADNTGLAVITKLDYYANGLLKKTTQAQGTVDESYVEYFYNSAHQLTQTQNNFCDYAVYTPSSLDGQWVSQRVYSRTTANDDSGNKCTGGDFVYRYERAFDALGRLSKNLRVTDENTFIDSDVASNQHFMLGYDQNNNVTTQLQRGDIVNLPTHDDDELATVNSYDALNRLTQTVGAFDCDPTASPSNCILNSSNNVEAVNIPAGSPTTVYSYNGQGLINSVTDANTNETTFIYNGFGELTQEDSPDRGITTYVYDGAGRLDHKTDSNNKTTCYAYDNLNRLTGVDYGAALPTPPALCSFSADITYAYDAVGRLITVTDVSATDDGTTGYEYDALGRLTKKTITPKETTGLSFVTDYVYNGVGALTQVTYPGAAGNRRIVDYSQSAGRLNNIAIAYAASSSATVDTIGYQPFGGINSYTRYFENSDAITRTRSHNTQGLLSNIEYELTNGTNPSAFFGLTYGYDAFNNIHSIDDDIDTYTSQTFVYDPLQRLQQATGIYGQYNYSYDKVGNRLTQQLKRAPANDPTNFTEMFTDSYLYQDQTTSADSKSSNRLESIERKNTNNDIIRNRTLTQDTAGNTTQDRTTDYVPGTATVEKDISKVLEYNEQNRMDDITPVDCQVEPADHPACE